VSLAACEIGGVAKAVVAVSRSKVRTTTMATRDAGRGGGMGWGISLHPECMPTLHGLVCKYRGANPQNNQQGKCSKIH
jgi:hypothetical protein